MRTKIILLALWMSAMPVFAAEPVLTANLGHSDEIISTEFSPDGKNLLSYSKYGVWILWDIQTGKELRRFGDQTRRFSYMQFSPVSDDDPRGGKYILGCIVSETGDSIIVIDKKTGNEIQKYMATSTHVDNLHYMPGGKQIIVLETGKIQILDALSGKSLRRFHVMPHFNQSGYSMYTDVIASPPEKNYAQGGKYLFLVPEIRPILHEKDKDPFIIRVEADNWKKRKWYSGHPLQVVKIVVSPDGKYFAVTYQDGSLELFKVSKKRPIYSHINDNSNSVGYLNFSPDGNSLIFADRKGIFGLDLATLKINEKLAMAAIGKLDIRMPVDAYKREVSYNCRSEQMAIGFSGGSIAVINPKLNKLKWLTSSISRIQDVDWDASGQYIISGAYDGEVNLWDMQTGRYLKSFEGFDYDVSQTRFLPGKKKVAAVGKENYTSTQKIWEIDSGKETYSETKNYRINFLADTKLEIKKDDEGIHFYDRASQQLLRTFPGKVNSYTVSPDMSLLATGNAEGEIKFYDIASGQLLRQLTAHNSSVGSLVFSPQTADYPQGGKYLVAKYKTVLFLINAINAAVIGNYSPGKKYNVDEIFFSTDGNKWMVAAGMYVDYELSILEGSVTTVTTILDCETAQPLKTIRGDGMRFNPDASRYAIAGADGSVKIFDTETGHLLLTLFKMKNSKDWLAVTPDGRFDGTEKAMALLYYVKGTEIIPLESLSEKFYTPGLVYQVIRSEHHVTPEIKIADILLPPLVKILSPEDGNRIYKKEVTLKIEVTDQGGGIEEIRLYHNGKRVESAQRGMKKQNTGKIRSFDFTFQLIDGENKFRVIALNTQRTESLPAEVSVLFEGERAEADLYLFVIGINDYKNANMSLNYATADARAFQESIEKSTGRIFRKSQIYTLFNSDALRLQILSYFSEIKTKAQPQDMFVFYYAGHGVMGEAVGKIPADYYLVPWDVTQLYGNEEVLAENGISSMELMEISREIRAQKQLFVLDACQSGGAIETFAMRGAAEQKAIMQLARSSGIVVLSASGSEQFATEFQSLGHGAFTYALLQGIDGAADGGEKDKKITVSELKAYIEDQLPQITEKYRGQAQYPTGYSRGQDFPVVVLE